ncbi:MAG: hypothetical protein IPP69_18105 [Flavobacteriales bacterium]|nr:hypothetical protein [Flavobacteriales bacterium]
MANSIELIADFGKKLSNDPFLTIRYILITLLFFLGVGVLFIWLQNNSIPSSISFIFAALASCVVGAFLGFLFGVPKSSRNEGSSEIFNIKEPYSENSNLVDVSDWLTKIIVGLSLTQWQYLMSQLHFGAGLIANAIAIKDGITPEKLMAFGYGTILFFLTTGFMLGYIYTRTIFFRILLTLRLDNVVAQQQMISYKRNLATQVTQEEVEKSVVSTSGDVMKFKTFVVH